MGDIGSLVDGFGTALQPTYLLYALLGVTLGTAVGVLPGIGPAMTVALLLPMTYKLEPTGAFIMFAGIYYGGMYGGSTTSILLNTPGESASIITAIEGNKMARSGRGAAALATAAIGSFVAGTIATVALTLTAPALADFAVTLGDPDYVALAVVALITVSALLGSSVSRGLASLSIGLLFGLVGTDNLTGQQRFTFGLPVLGDGIDVVIRPPAEALEALKHFTPHILISDIGMPEEDGYTLMQKIRAWEKETGRDAQIPAIALTAYARAEDRQQSLDSGYQVHISKPIEPFELTKLVENLVRH